MLPGHTRDEALTLIAAAAPPGTPIGNQDHQALLATSFGERASAVLAAYPTVAARTPPRPMPRCTPTAKSSAHS